MKKLLALFLVIVMMFSMTSVSYASNTETSSTKIETYMSYLEEKLDTGNLFVRFVAKIVIFGIMLGFIKVEDFEDWFDNMSPDTDTNIDNTNKSDWEDGTELTLFHTQSLPYTKSFDYYENDITIKDITITKEHYNNTYSNMIFNYKYYITINGSSSKKLQEHESVLVNIHFQGETHFIPGFNGSSERQGSFTVYENNDFTITGIYYSDCDADYYTIYDLSMWNDYE